MHLAHYHLGRAAGVVLSLNSSKNAPPPNSVLQLPFAADPHMPALLVLATVAPAGLRRMLFAGASDLRKHTHTHTHHAHTRAVSGMRTFAPPQSAQCHFHFPRSAHEQRRAAGECRLPWADVRPVSARGRRSAWLQHWGPVHGNAAGGRAGGRAGGWGQGGVVRETNSESSLRAQ